jgi:hypothetical protein
MNIATGEVLTDLRKGHAGADVLRFFKQIDATVPGRDSLGWPHCDGGGWPHLSTRRAVVTELFGPTR